MTVKTIPVTKQFCVTLERYEQESADHIPQLVVIAEDSRCITVSEAAPNVGSVSLAVSYVRGLFRNGAKMINCCST
jgi:hypothetical protein